MKRLFYIVILQLVIVPCIFAQQLPISNQYFVNRYALAPAYAGYNGNLELFINYRQDWVGVPGAPVRTNIGANGNFFRNMGIGISVSNEQIGNFANFTTDFTYAYHIMFSNIHSISFGLNAKVLRSQYNASKVGTQGFDPFLASGEVLLGTSYDFDASVLYHYQNLNFGLGTERLLGTDVNLNNATKTGFDFERHYFSHISYFYDINRKFRAEAVGVFRANGAFDLIYDAGFAFSYKRQVWLNTMYRSNQTMVFAVGSSVYDNLVISYAYEAGIGGIGKYTSGSHEISIGFLINRTRSVRPLPTAFRPASNSESFLAKLLDFKIDSVNKNVTIVKEGYESQIGELNKRIDSLKSRPTVLAVTDKEKKEEIKPPVLEPGWEMEILKNLEFAKGSNQIFSSSYPILNRLAARMTKRPTLVIKIVGHTDNIGASRNNLDLSMQRAQAVMDYLVTKKAIDPSRISVEGKGEDEPIDTNDTEAGKANNRRIEVKFKDMLKRE